MEGAKDWFILIVIVLATAAAGSFFTARQLEGTACACDGAACDCAKSLRSIQRKLDHLHEHLDRIKPIGQEPLGNAGAWPGETP